MDLAEAWPRGATPHPRSGVAAKRSYPTSKVRGGGQECQASTAQERLRGATPCRRSGAVAERSYPMLEARGGGREAIPLVQGKEQWLRFAGAAVKRYPTFMVRETQVRR